ncbi:MAG: Acyltransferase [Gallionellaceae bacterium]|nr:MAG: Acyltransferase [Gallionellaceae bacterium]
MFANGAAGVTIFFILSGVVLGLSLDFDKSRLPSRYGKFLIKRFFRIYPAHVVCLLILCTVLIVFGIVNPGTFEKSSMFYNWFYRTAPDARAIITNLMLKQTYLNSVTWSVKVEMIVALFFPVLHLVSRANNNRAPFVQLIILLLLIGLSIVNPGGGVVLPHVYKFYLGLLIPTYGMALAAFFKYKKLSISTPTIVTLSIVAILVERQLVYGSYPGFGVIQALGAAVLIYVLMQNSGGWLFRLKALKKLGQYSYSFYLWHFPILWLMYYGLHTNLIFHGLIHSHAFALACVICVISIFAAYLFALISYLAIEHRGIIFGRNVATKFWS